MALQDVQIRCSRPLKQRHPVSSAAELAIWRFGGGMLTSTTRNLAVQPLCSRLWVHLHPQPLPRTHSGRAEAKCGLTGLAESRVARAGRRRESNRNPAVLDALGGGDGWYHHLRAPDSEFGLGGAHLGARGPIRAPRMGPGGSPEISPAIPGQAGSTRALRIPTLCGG